MKANSILDTIGNSAHIRMQRLFGPNDNGAEVWIKSERSNPGGSIKDRIGLAMIEADEPIDQAYLDKGAWEVEIAGRRYPAVASLRPLYDPEAKRIKM